MPPTRLGYGVNPESALGAAHSTIASRRARNGAPFLSFWEDGLSRSNWLRSVKDLAKLAESGCRADGHNICLGTAITAFESWLVKIPVAPRFVFAASLALLFSVLAAAVVRAADRPPALSPSKPNIVFILSDDVGYGDLVCYGANKVTHRT